MKEIPGLVRSAKITNIVSAGVMFLSGLSLLIFPSLATLKAQQLLLGLLFGLVGLAKLFGYFSNDLYRLAFQFDFAIGIFCLLLTLLFLLLPTQTLDFLPAVVSLYTVLDALLKAQTALDARRFGMKGWLSILLSAVLLFGAGLLVLGAELYGVMNITMAVGIAFMSDGIENSFVTAYTVRVRARKKNRSREFGLEE